MSQEQVALSHVDQMLNMVGSHGIFAIIGSIVVIRALRALWYMEKRESFVLSVFVSALIGAGSVYFYAEIHDLRAILGGAFMTPIGSMIAYEVIKWAIAALYEKTGMETLRALFFFLSPKPMRHKKDGIRWETPPHSDLTRLFEKTRLDK